MTVGEANVSPAPWVVRSRLGVIWKLWGSRRLERAARALALAAGFLLFLDAAATIEVVYTLRPSFLLFGLALALGAPVALRGWLSLTPWLGWSAVGLVIVHMLATAFGDQATLPGNARAGSQRDLLYIADIAMGIGVVGLLVGLFGNRSAARVRPLLIALCAGGVVAGTYGLYQWFAQRYALPLSHVNNTLDSNGVTFDGLQGAGLFGWERIRGTFLEPHFLGAYLAAMAPAVVALHMTSRGWLRRGTVLGLCLVLAALMLTASAPAYAAVGAGAVVTFFVVAVARGRVRVIILAGAMVAAVAVSVPVVLAAPQVLASATGRSAEELRLTTQFRQTAWTASIDIWSRRPALGHGAGQSSVQLARELAGADSRVPLSAQGLWAATLIDTGALGLAFWVMLLGGLFMLASRRLVRQPSPLRGWVLFAATAALLSSQMAGDRLVLSTWALLGLLLAASTVAPRSADAAATALESEPTVDERPLSAS